MHGRAAQEHALRQVLALGECKTEMPAPLTIVYGGASTGKSLCMQALVWHDREIVGTVVDAAGIFTPSDFYREVLAQIADSQGNKSESTEQDEDELVIEKQPLKTKEEHTDNGSSMNLNFLSFVKALDRTMKLCQQKKLYLVVDQADRLLDRKLASLLTCVCSIGTHLAYTNIFKEEVWSIHVVLVMRATSLEMNHVIAPFTPLYIYFPPYTNEDITNILVEHFEMEHVEPTFRQWTTYLFDLLPSARLDWLDFRQQVQQLLPDFEAFLAQDTSNTTVSLQRSANDSVSKLMKKQRRHLFGFEKRQDNFDGTQETSIAELSHSSLLLVVAGYLASFNPQDTDDAFLSSTGGRKQKRRKKATTAAPTTSQKMVINQLLIGPKPFPLQRLLAIYDNIRQEAAADLDEDDPDSTTPREEIFTHLATLMRMQLFQRTSATNSLDDIRFRCLATANFVHDVARTLEFPLDTYLNPR